MDTGRARVDRQRLNSVLVPSDDQKAIIQSTSQNLIIQANAGAAKTTTLALKARHLLNQSSNNLNVLFLVFTTTAQEAAIDALERVGLSKTQMRCVDVLTFDEFSQKILRSIEGKAVPYKSTVESVAPYVRQAMTELSLRGDSGFIERFLKRSRGLKGRMDIDRAKWNEYFNIQDFSDNHGVEPEMVRLYLRYEKLRFDHECDGFDRPLFRSEFDATYDLAWLLADPEKRTPLFEMGAWPQQLHALLVDEMHDLNFAMFTIIENLLESTVAQFCGVGDRDQVIFSDHGAQEEFMSAAKIYGNRKMKSLPLTVSYRCGSELAQFASRLASDKDYACLPGLKTPVVIKFYDDAGQASCNQLLLAQVKQWRQLDGNDVSGSAILLRHSWQSVELENLLIEADIHYAIRGFVSYLEQPEILLVRALHAIATDNESNLGNAALRGLMVESLAFFFGIDLPHKESKSESVDERLEIAVSHAIKDGNMRLFVENVLLVQCSPNIRRRVTSAMSIFSQQFLTKNDFEKILDSLEIEKWVDEVFIEHQRKADALKYFDALKTAILKNKSINNYFSWLSDYENRRVGLSRSENTRALKNQKLENRTLKISLASEVKGLEFNNVVIPYLEDGVFPLNIGLGLQEEKNLLYVAATRAKKNLTLLVSNNRPSKLLGKIK